MTVTPTLLTDQAEEYSCRAQLHLMHVLINRPNAAHVSVWLDCNCPAFILMPRCFIVHAWSHLVLYIPVFVGYTTPLVIDLIVQWTLHVVGYRVVEARQGVSMRAKLGGGYPLLPST